jgi:hypothetical protein
MRSNNQAVSVKEERYISELLTCSERSGHSLGGELPVSHCRGLGSIPW